MKFINSVIQILLFTVLLTGNACQAKNQTSHWFNVDYVNCLSYSLPCECEKSLESYFSITLDTTDVNTFGVSLMKSGEMEPNYYQILRSTNAYEYDIKRRNGELLAKVSFAGDTLILDEQDVIMRFIKSKSTSSIRPGSIENIGLLNKAFLMRDYSSLEEILNQDSLQCYCNKWLGDLNLISVRGKPDSWVLKKSGGTLSIFEIAPRNDPDDPVKLRELNSFQWE